MRTAIGLAVMMLVGGCSSKHYCDLCGQIREIQAKTNRNLDDSARLEKLKKDYADRAAGAEAFRSVGGAAVDLHPDCDCECHVYALTRR